MLKYAIVTPVRDEEKYVAATIEAIIQQSIRPMVWVIVDDGSSDRTMEILEGYAEKHAWIQVVRRANRGHRLPGRGVVEAFYDGYRTIESDDWQFLVKFDADLVPEPDYFKRCLQHFIQDTRLGIGGGEIVHRDRGNLEPEKTPRFHVRGATKIYRRDCWEDIGGLFTGTGWDTVDEIKANALGWQTYSFTDVPLLHLRRTGSAQGSFSDNVKHGVVCYATGYHPLFVIASSIRRLPRKPYVAGSFAILLGYFKSYFTRPRRVEDRSLIRYVRAQQLRRLCGLETIWR
jgi:glycosyltransferase involved in cell wall biosynthesis